MKYRTLRILSLLCALLCAVSLAACSEQVYDPTDPNGDRATESSTSPHTDDTTPEGSTSETDTSAETTPDSILPAGHYAITCDGNRYTASHGDVITTDGSALVLIKGGTYVISGERQGQIRVDVAKTEEVTLVLDGLTATSVDTAPLYIQNADRVYIEVPAGKTSTLTDASTYVFPEGKDKPNACIYGADDLTFRGEGTLVVNGNYNNGIGCKNDVVIESGTITVCAPNNAIKGNGSVTVTGTANVTITGGEDGIKSDSLVADKGFVLIDGNAQVSVTCLDDALQAVSYITVTETARVLYKCDGQPANGGESGIINVAEGSMIPME